MPKFLTLLIVLLYSVKTQDFDSDQQKAYEDTSKTVSEYLISYGYNFEEHKVSTADGYILSLWRLPKRMSERRTKRQPILLLHGIMDNAFSWLFKRIKHNLGTILVDQGYDVWLGNNRGTIRSLEHVNPKDYDWRGIQNQYWDFSFSEMGEYDLPAMIQYIQDCTGYEKVLFIGHSQGAVQYFIKAMLEPDYINKNIKAFIGLAPVLFMQNVVGKFIKLLNGSRFFDLLYLLKFKNFWTFPSLTHLFVPLCRHFPSFVNFVVRTIAGSTKNNTMDPARFQVAAMNEPGGTSTQNLLHWMQLIRKPEPLRRFDFGKEENLRRYGQIDPPEYDVGALKRLTPPMYLLAGKAESIMSTENLEKLMEVVPENTLQEYVEDYAHLDYIWADDAHVKIYPKMLDFLLIHK